MLYSSNQSRALRCLFCFSNDLSFGHWELSGWLLCPLGPLSFVFFPLTGAWMAHGAAVVPTCSSTPSPTLSLLGDSHTDMATAWFPQDGGAWTALLPEPGVQAASCALVSAWERGRPFPGHTLVPSLYRCSDASLRDHESRLQEGPESL